MADDGRVERRPGDSDYYVERRTELLSQGDIFESVPLTYPGVGAEVAQVESSRFFISGPLEPGPAILITPTCQMTAQGQPAAGYAHNVRTMLPILDARKLVRRGAVKESSLAETRRIDHLYSYMYLPALGDSYAESFALLYMPITVDHELLITAGRRVAQLQLEGARQLLRKLVLFSSSLGIPRHMFKPPMD